MTGILQKVAQCELRVGLLIVAFFIGTVLVGCRDSRTPDQFRIPHEFDGVVVTVFDQPGFPPHQRANGYRIHSYPSDGILITSDQMDEGWARDQILDIYSDGTEKILEANEVVGRRVHFSATGSRSREGHPEIEYLLIAVGVDPFTTAAYESAIDRASEKVVRSIDVGNEE